MDVLEVDGSYGEGGGQVLRTSVALSTVTGQPIRVTSIRANRPNPGLSFQHVTAISGVATLCGAEVEGNVPGSTELRFSPGDVVPGAYHMDTGTAGAISLVLQALVLSSVRAGGRMEFSVAGGTNVRWSPPLDHYSQVLFPLLRGMGVDLSMDIERRGFYPKGGGLARVVMEPVSTIGPLDLRERGAFKGVKGVCFTRNLPDHVAERMAHSFEMAAHMGGVEMVMDRGRGHSTGAGLSVAAVYENTRLAGGCLGDRGMPSESVGATAAETLRTEVSSGATLDVFTADQLVPFLAMASGCSVFRVRDLTGHLLTQMWLLERFLDVWFGIGRDDTGGFEIEVRPNHT